MRTLLFPDQDAGGQRSSHQRDQGEDVGARAGGGHVSCFSMSQLIDAVKSQVRQYEILLGVCSASGYAGQRTHRDEDWFGESKNSYH